MGESMNNPLPKDTDEEKKKEEQLKQAAEIYILQDQKAREQKAAEKLQKERRTRIGSFIDTVRRVSNNIRYFMYNLQFNLWLAHQWALFVHLLGNAGRVLGDILVEGIPISRAIVLGVMGMWEFATSFTKTTPREGMPTRFIKALVGIGLIALGIMVIATPHLALTITMTSIALTTLRDFWYFATALKSRQSGSWKKERDEHEQDKDKFYNELAKTPKIVYTNKAGSKIELTSVEFIKQVRENKITEDEIKTSEVAKKIITFDKNITENTKRLHGRDVELGTKLHTFIIGVVALTGAALLFTPAAPLGAALLLGTAIYGLMRKYDWPWQWASKISKKIFGEPKPIPPAELEKEIFKRQPHPGPEPKPHESETEIFKVIHGAEAAYQNLHEHNISHNKTPPSTSVSITVQPPKPHPQPEQKEGEEDKEQGPHPHSH